jgi:hypothetical protein
MERFLEMATPRERRHKELDSAREVVAFYRSFNVGLREREALFSLSVLLEYF